MSWSSVSGKGRDVWKSYLTPLPAGETGQDSSKTKLWTFRDLTLLNYTRKWNLEVWKIIHNIKFSNSVFLLALLKGSVGCHQPSNVRQSSWKGIKQLVNAGWRERRNVLPKCELYVERQPLITRTEQKRAATGKNPSRGGVYHTPRHLTASLFKAKEGLQVTPHLGRYIAQ